MQVRDVMTGNVISVKADESIVRAARLMVRASGRKVEEVMTRDPVTVSEDDTWLEFLLGPGRIAEEYGHRAESPERV